MIATVAFMSLIVSGPGTHRQEVKHTAPYVNLAGRFRRETAGEVAEELASWPEAWVQSAIRDLNGFGGVTPRVILMELHTGLYLLDRNRKEPGEFHLGVAVNLSSDWVRAGATPDFYQPLYLLLSSTLQRLWRVRSAIDLLDGARRVFPRNHELTVALGSVYEAAGSRFGIAMSSGADPPWSSRLLDEMVMLIKARDLFEGVRSVDPANLEASLRLGRVMYLQKHREQATMVLSGLRAQRPDNFINYMSALFLGRISEDDHEYERAASLYREATELFPASQAAFIGLSHALHAAGDPSAATRGIETMIESKQRKTNLDDPWWQYHFGQARHFATLMEQLWKTAVP
jgi:tetratricopeptide (TPR) repeat protein